LRAVATDDQGAVRSSEPVAIRVVATNVPPLVRLLTPDGVATEPVGAGTSTAEPDVGRFRVVRSGSMDLPLTVFFHVAGSAVNGVDYSAIVGHVTIPAGAEGESIVIRPLADNRVEGPESVVLSLHSPVLTSGDILPPLPYIIGEPSRGQMLLQDADAGNENRPPEVALLRPLAGAVLKRQAEHLIQVHAADRDGFIVRLEAFANDVRIDDQALDPLVAPATGLGGTFLLRWNNALPGEYRLRVRATDNQGASRLSEPVMVRVVEALERTIIDVVAADAEAAEETATAGTEQGDTGLFRLRRRGNLSEPVEVHFQLRGSAVPEKDYRMTETSTAGTSAGAQAAGGAVRFAAGQSEMWLVIRPIDDLLVEPTETVILELSPPICPLIHPPPPGCYQVGEAGRATVFIRDNDEHRNMSPHVAIAGPAPGQQFAAKAEVEIRVQTRDLDGWVSQMEFFVGDRKLGDSVVHFLVPPEPTARQRFSLVWTNVPAGEHVLRARATDNLGAAAWAEPVAIRVREADALPVMDLFARDFRAGETGQNGEVPDTATFVIRRRGSTESPVSVQLEIGGIAQNGVDYETLPTVLTIAAGERLAEIVVRPVDDAEVEPRESVVLRLVPPAAGTTAGYEIGLSARAAAVIVDNDHTVSPPEEERPATARALGDGVVHVVVTGQIAEEVVVEGTDNLLDWYEIARGFMTDGQIDFVEAAVREHAARFYRVVPVSSGLPVVDAQRIFGE
jgi:hypothetical protein